MRLNLYTTLLPITYILRTPSLVCSGRIVRLADDQAGSVKLTGFGPILRRDLKGAANHGPPRDRDGLSAVTKSCLSTIPAVDSARPR